MTKEILEFNTREERKAEIKLRAGVMRPMFPDFVNGKYKITFVDELDDPDNDPVLVAQRAADKVKRDRDKELKQKIKDGTSTKAEDKEILKRLAEML